MNSIHRRHCVAFALLALMVPVGVSCTGEAEPKGPTKATSPNRTPFPYLVTTPGFKGPWLEELAITTQLSKTLARRVEIGPKTGVFLEVDRDCADAATVLGSPAMLAGSLATAGLGPPWPSQAITCRPLTAGKQKRVLIETSVCLRQGFLEHLYSHGGKRHESILWSDAEAVLIHTALLAAGAKPGKPVQFRSDEPKRDFRAASGERISIKLQYEENGKLKTVPAQQWIRYAKTKKPLQRDWVFAGSYRFKDPDGNVHYAASDGRYICVTNFSNAMLDLPFESQDGDPQHGLDFEASTEAIPPVDTKVLLILEPLGAANGK